MNIDIYLSKYFKTFVNLVSNKKRNNLNDQIFVSH